MNLLSFHNRKKKRNFGTIGCSLMAASALYAVAGLGNGLVSASSVFPMQQFNVIVLGTPDANNPSAPRTSVGTFNDGSDIQGNAFINGDVSGTTFAGNGLPSGATTGLEATGGITSSSVIVDHGDVVLGGTAATGFRPNSGGTIAQNALQPATDLANFTSALTNASNQWAGLATTAGTSVTTGNSSMNFTIPTGAGNFIVFNISSSNFGQNDSIEFTNLGANQQVLINVSDTTFAEPGGVNFNGNSTTADNVIWNFNNATSISLSSGFYGSILAPNATLTDSSTITGNVAVAKINSAGEIDLASMNSTPPLNPVPAGGPLPVPASFGLVAMGSIALLAGTGLRKRVRM